ncbi:hypothetical protein BASA60_004459 [Batrachochytrium salamandrivorans]|nr:hypothetical protein BASA60_004459 [Batrachochytrium salamandrivorans]
MIVLLPVLLVLVGRMVRVGCILFLSHFRSRNPIGVFSLEVEAAGIERFTVFQADGKTVAAKKRRRSATDKQKFSIPVSAVVVLLVTTESPLLGPWVIGNGVKYVSDVDSSLEAFFTAPVGTEINIGLDVDLDTELDFDFLYLSVKSSGGVEDFLTRSKSRDGTKAFYGISGRMVMGKAYYGLQLVGGNKSHLAPLQTTINKGIRLFTGARLSTAIGSLLVETGIGSLLTRSLVSRVRLLERSVTKKTPINAICSGSDQRQSSNDTRLHLMETLRTCGDSASLQKYVTRQLLDTSGFFKDPSFDQSRAHGTRYLMLARMDALWTARKAIQIGILVDTHPFSVDHCILCDQQLLSTSIAHLVVECEQVAGHRIQSGLVPAIQKSRLRLLGRALDPGVENVYTWLRGGVLNGEADLDQQFPRC